MRKYQTKPSFMKTSRFFILTMLIFLILCSGPEAIEIEVVSRPEALEVVTDHATMGLPQGAKVRIGKGSISNGSNVIAYSPDGTRIAVASSIGVWIYDARTYQEIALLTGHAGPVESIAYSPDGSRLVSGGEDGTVRFWDTASGTLLHTVKSEIEYLSGTRGTRPIGVLAFSPDGRTIAHEAGRDIYLRSATTGKLLKTFMGPRREEEYIVTALAFSPDGSKIISGHQHNLAGSLYLWSVATGKLLREIDEQQLEGIDVDIQAIRDVTFSPDGSTIAATTSYGFGGSQIFLIPTSEGKPKFEKSGVARPTFSPDGSTIAVIPTGMVNLPPDIDGEIALISAATGKILKVLTGVKYKGIEIKKNQDTEIIDLKEVASAGGSGGGVDDIAFSPDRSTVAGVGGGFLVWSATTGEVLKNIADHGVGNFAFSPDGTTIATYSKLWSVATGKLFGRFVGMPRGTRKFTFTPDGEKIVAAGKDKFCLLDLDKSSALMKMRPVIGKWIDVAEEHSLVFDINVKSLCYRIADVWTINENVVGVDDFAFVSGGDKIIAVVNSRDGSGDIIKQTKTWTVATGELTSTINISEVDWSDEARLSPDGSVIAVEVRIGVKSTTVQLRSVATAELLKTINTPLYRLTFSPDGSVIAVRGERALQLRSVATGQVLKTINADHAIEDLAFSPDGSVIAVRGERVLQLRSVATAEVLKTINADYAIEDLAFSPDGSVIAVEVRIGEKKWALQLRSVATGQVLKTINARYLAFSPDGSAIATRGDGGTVILWGTQ